MSEKQSETWYNLLQKQAETHQLCHKGLMFHRKDFNKGPEAINHPCHKSTTKTEPRSAEKWSSIFI